MSIKDLADQLAAKGRYGDTELVHMTKGEVAGLQGLAEAAGGSLTINPETGKPEAFFLAALLPTILGAAAPALGAAATGAGMAGLGGFLSGKFGAMGLGALTGALMNRQNPLMGAVMGGMGGAGGGNIANALTNAGTTTAQVAAQPLAESAGQAAVDQATADFAKRRAIAEGAKLSGAEAAQFATSGQTMPPVDLTAPNLDAIRNQAMGDAYMNATPKGFAALGQGITSLGSETGRDAFMKSIGGGGGLMKSGIMAASPGLYEYMMPKQTASTGGEEEEDTEDLMNRYTYDAGYTGGAMEPGSAFTGERRYFRPSYVRAAQGGAVKKFADGGAASAPSSTAGPARGMSGVSADAMNYLYQMNPAQQDGGASVDAMQYLMGQTPTTKRVQPAPVQKTPFVAPKRERSTIADTEGYDLINKGQYKGLYQKSTPTYTFDPGSQQYFRTDPVFNYVQPVASYYSPFAYGGGDSFSGFGGGGGGGFGFGGVNASDTGNLGFGGGSLGGFASDGVSSSDSGPSEGADGSPGGGYAEGGLAALARGGMKAGGFVVPADVVSMVGEGNTDAGYDRIKRMIPGATPIKGKDGGQADTVATSIEGKQPARVAHGEMYVPPAAVKRAGGAKKLYAMMKNVRQQATGSKAQIKPVNLKKAMA